MESPNNSLCSLNSNDIAISEYKEAISVLQSDNSLLKNKLAVTQEVLKRYKLNDMTELVKELVMFIQKDLQNCISILKENAEIQSLTITTQQDQLIQMKALINETESKSQNSLKPSPISYQKEKSLTEDSQFFHNFDSQRPFSKDQLRKVDALEKSLENIRNEHKLLSDRLNKKEESLKGMNGKYLQAVKKIEVLGTEKRKIEERNAELENDKKKILEKWQRYVIFSAVGKNKNEDALKIKAKETEDQLDIERKKSEGYLIKLKESNRRLEEFKELYNREKHYSEELTMNYKKLHAQSKNILEEKDLLAKLNQELSEKLILSSNLQPHYPDFMPAQHDLNKTAASKKSQESTKPEFKSPISQRSSRKHEPTIGSYSDSILTQKYETLMEKYQKLQAEKTQIQSMYINSTSVITEKNNQIQELVERLNDLEEKMLLFGMKPNEKGCAVSVCNTTTSKSTNKSSPTRSKTPGEIITSKLVF